MTESAYPALTSLENAFKTIVWTPMIKAGEMWIEGQVPFLALPVMRTLEEGTINEITDAIYRQIILFIDVSAIRLRMPILQNKWAKAVSVLTLVAAEQGEHSDAYKKALDEASKDFATWIHTGPVQLPNGSH